MESVLQNLPLQTTSFVGRQQEIKEIAGLLADPSCRLLTLVGPSGIGRTRLTLEVAGREVKSKDGYGPSKAYTDGVYPVALQPVAVLSMQVSLSTGRKNRWFDVELCSISDSSLGILPILTDLAQRNAGID